jgi:hypothetical protein
MGESGGVIDFGLALSASKLRPNVLETPDELDAPGERHGGTDDVGPRYSAATI